MGGSYDGFFGALGPAPAALADEEAAALDDGVGLAAAPVDEGALRLDDGARLALVVHADDLAADLELAAGRGHGQGAEEGYFALAVDDAARVELGHPRDRLRAGTAVEVDDVLVRVLEGQDDGVGGKDGEVGVQLVEEVQVRRGGAADAGGEEEGVALEPADGEGGVLVAGAGVGHVWIFAVLLVWFW